MVTQEIGESVSQLEHLFQVQNNKDIFDTPIFPPAYKHCYVPMCIMIINQHHDPKLKLNESLKINKVITTDIIT